MEGGKHGMMPAGIASAAAPEVGPEEPEGNVTPEEQAIYGKFMENYYRVVYGGDKGEGPLAQEIVVTIQNTQDKVLALGASAEAVVRELADSAETAGKPIPKDVLMHAGTEVIGDLADLVEAAGIYDYTQDEMGKALQVGMSMYAQSKGVPKEVFEQDFAMLQQAERDGTIEDVIPGITDVASRADTEMPVEQGAPVPGLRRA